MEQPDRQTEKGQAMMPNPFDAVMFVLLVIGALQGIGWLPW
ncbi:hypothetical protein [Enterobacter roggenkampii]